MTDLRIHSLKDLPGEHLLGPGTGMCAGCGGLGAVQQEYDQLGSRSVFVNAAGCMTLLANWPFTPFRGGFLYTSMASAPAGAQGVRDALDLLIAKGRIPPDEDMTAVVLAVYTVVLLASLLMLPELNYGTWAGLFAAGWMKVLTLLAIASLCWHAWIGVRDIYMDYIKPTGLRLFLQVGTIVLLVAYAFWAVVILWRV